MQKIQETVQILNILLLGYSMSQNWYLIKNIVEKQELLSFAYDLYNKDFIFFLAFTQGF